MHPAMDILSLLKTSELTLSLRPETASAQHAIADHRPDGGTTWRLSLGIAAGIETEVTANEAEVDAVIPVEVVSDVVVDTVTNEDGVGGAIVSSDGNAIAVAGGLTPSSTEEKCTSYS